MSGGHFRRRGRLPIQGTLVGGREGERAGDVPTLVEKTLTLLGSPAFHHGLAAFFNLTAFDLRVAG